MRVKLTGPYFVPGSPHVATPSTQACVKDPAQNFSGYLAPYADSRMLDADGAQYYYVNCSAKRGAGAVQLPLFYADGRNRYTKVLDDYVDLARPVSVLVPASPHVVLILVELTARARINAWCCLPSAPDHYR